MPTYVFVNVRWAVTTSYKALYFTSGNRGANGRGGIFTLSPPECDATNPNPEGHIFPPGYCSLVSSTFEYLLAHGDGSCVTSASLGVADKYDNGILCSRPLRSLKVYTRGDNVAGGKAALTVTLLKDGAVLSTQVASKLVSYYCTHLLLYHPTHLLPHHPTYLLLIASRSCRTSSLAVASMPATRTHHSTGSRATRCRYCPAQRTSCGSKLAVRSTRIRSSSSPTRSSATAGAATS